MPRLVNPRLLRTSCLALALIGCGSSSQAPRVKTDATDQRLDAVSRLLPLKDNTVYSFDTLAESTGERGILILQVTRPEPSRIELKMGSKIERLEVASDGIRLLTGGYLLKTPLARGAKFQGQSGVVQIIDTDKAIQVPAGSFVGCLETREEAVTLGVTKRVSTIFCPNVGIVSLIAEATDDGSAERETAILKSFGERVDIDAPSTP